MSNCHDIQNELSALIDGELTAARRAAVESHLATCAACRQRVDELRQLAAGVNVLPELESSPRFLAEVREKIRGVEKRSWSETLFLPLWLKPPLEALALVAILVTATVLLRPPPSSPALQAKVDRSETARERLNHKLELTDRQDTPALIQGPPAAPASKSLGESVLAKEEQGEIAATPAAPIPSGSVSPSQATTPTKPEAVVSRKAGATELAFKYQRQSSADESKNADTSGGGGWGRDSTAASTAAEAPVPLETITFAGDADKVRKEAETVAGKLGGQVLIRDQKQDVYVELPAQNVNEFKHQLAGYENSLATTFRGGDSGGKEAVAFDGTAVIATNVTGVPEYFFRGTTTDKDVSGLPTVLLQIQIVPTNTLGIGSGISLERSGPQ